MGGIVGFAYSASPVVKNTTMNNIVVNQEVPHNLCARSPRAGGITSILLYQPTDFETAEEIVMYENIDINDILVNIKTYDEEGNEVFSGLSEVGGLVGLTDFAAAVTGFSEYTGDPVELSPAREINLIADNISIKNTGDTFEDGTPKGIHGYGYAGGILGFGKATLNSISLENIDIESYLSAGGAVGHTDSATSIVGFDYKDSTITTFDANRGPNNCHTGGVLGYVGKDSLVKDATIDNVLINNEGYGNVGGIVGLTNKTNAVEVGVTIINAAVKNCTKELEDGTKLGITGKAHVGGFIGFGKINATYGPYCR